jgi:hypothetical protein
LPNKRENIKDIFKIKKDTIISEDLILNNSEVTISRGINIFLTKKASLYFYNSNITYNGQENNSIKFISKGLNSLYFNNCKKLDLPNLYFYGFSNINTKYNLPSAITFYKTNVKINNCVFEKNKFGDDLLNFFKSNFSVYNSEFIDSKSDAIDSDFSNGEVKNCRFINIGNDAVDLSGSKVSISKNLFENVGDKILSVGENSESIITKNFFLNSELGVVVKDGSNIILSKNKYKNNKVDLVAFRKKTFYDYPTINFFENQNIKNMIDKRSCLNNFHQVVNYRKNIEKLLYGKFYGKSSK